MNDDGPHRIAPAAPIPGDAEAIHRRGLALAELGRTAEAAASFQRVTELAPKNADAYNDWGIALHELGRLDEALASFDKAIALESRDAFVFANRARLLKDMRRHQDAIADCNHALAFQPGFAGALSVRGLCELALGDFARGWADYEARPGAHELAGARAWQGEDLRGRAILVRAEQGFGDIFQFCRYLPLLAERGADVTFAVPQELHRVLGGLRKVRLQSDAAGRFDYQCALLGLPHRFGTGLSNVPNAVPYLFPDFERSEQWRARIGDGFKIGVCWQGGPKILGRSFPLSALAPLARVPGVRLVSLQKHDGLDQLASAGFTVETLGADFDAGADAFADAAAAMPHLDLVVTCDTSIAHLAGALARPTWVALQWAPDWRWLLERDDSPWYPTLRLFRQKTNGDWAPVFAEMAAALAPLAAAKSK